MAGRRYADDVSIYEDRRSTVSRGGRRVYEDRYVDEEIDYRRPSPAAPTAVREREVVIRDEVRERPSNTPAFMREDYARTAAGPVVLRAREREDFEYAPRPRRRSPSPEPERKVEKEEIIITRDQSESRPPPRQREVEREEIVIRRDEREVDRRPPPPREREREEIIIRREEKDHDPRPPPPVNSSKDEIIIRREEKESDRRSRYDDYSDTISRRGGPRSEVDRDEIIIRREESKLDPSRYEDYALTRPKSHERARSRARRSSSGSNDEIIIRRDEVRGRSGDIDRQEIIIRKNSRSPSPSSISSAPAPRVAQPPPPQIINAPTIHQEVITHHRHIDHGFEVQYPTRPRVISRPPSPPSPPLPPPAPAPASVRARSEERIQISRTQTRNGRTENEEIIIDRNEAPTPPRSVAPYSTPPPPREAYYDTPPRREYRGYERDVQEEAEYYNQRALDRAYVGEASHGATRDWALVDVPPGTNRVRMDGAGGGAQEITWQRYNGVRRSKFFPDGADEGYTGEVGRHTPAPLPAPAPLPDPRYSPAPAHNGEIGKRYGKERNPTDGLWTEVTKDLVVKEAIQEMGYEFEENDDFYYIIAYLRYVSLIIHQ